jgi:hypothetical protein
MIYISGSAKALVNLYGSNYLATLYSPRQGTHIALGERWAADNDCYTLGDQFNLDVYLTWLECCRPYQRNCLFATAPDVVGDASATLERSMPVLPMLRDLGYKPAFVAQDGIRIQDIPWEAFDCLFIGGTTEWKLSPDARLVAKLAKGVGKWVHMGRVNSARRFLIAYKWGCHSVDGNYLRFGPDTNFPRLKQWLRINEQTVMEGVL